jgi:peptidoglycan/LPS O-acetylase OafA/YrhL
MERQHVDYLDGWRGLAIGLVLVGHFVGPNWSDPGRLGVDLFFVLSGVLMARILFEQHTPLGEFYRRRVSRILPAYLLFLVIICGPVAWAQGLQVGWSEIWPLLTFLRTYIGPVGIWSDPLPIGHIWSLNVEEHCYLIMSLITVLALAKRWPAVALGALGAASFCATYWHLRHNHDPLTPFLINTECVAAFILLSAAYRISPLRRKLPQWAPLLALAAALPWYVSFPGVWRGMFVRPLLLGFAINHVGESPQWFLALLRARWLRWLGVVSYSIYLWQQPFFRGIPMIGKPLGALGAVAAGVMSFYLLERPVRSWLNEHWGPGKPGAGTGDRLRSDLSATAPPVPAETPNGPGPSLGGQASS